MIDQGAFVSEEALSNPPRGGGVVGSGCEMESAKLSWAIWFYSAPSQECAPPTDNGNLEIIHVHNHSAPVRLAPPAPDTPAIPQKVLKFRDQVRDVERSTVTFTWVVRESLSLIR